jgi:hypothetical protein
MDHTDDIYNAFDRDLTVDEADEQQAQHNAKLERKLERRRALAEFHGDDLAYFGIFLTAALDEQERAIATVLEERYLASERSKFLLPESKRQTPYVTGHEIWLSTVAYAYDPTTGHEYIHRDGAYFRITRESIEGQATELPEEVEARLVHRQATNRYRLDSNGSEKPISQDTLRRRVESLIAKGLPIVSTSRASHNAGGYALVERETDAEESLSAIRATIASYERRLRLLEENISRAEHYGRTGVVTPLDRQNDERGDASLKARAARGDWSVRHSRKRTAPRIVAEQEAVYRAADELIVTRRKQTARQPAEEPSGRVEIRVPRNRPQLVEQLIDLCQAYPGSHAVVVLLPGETQPRDLGLRVQRSAELNTALKALLAGRNGGRNA